MTELYNYKVNEAIRILITKIKYIRYVNDWSREANISRRWLYSAMKKTFKKEPKIIVREVRFEVIISYLKYNPDAYGDEVASIVGLKNSKYLYKFLLNYKMNFTELKEKILNGEFQPQLIWLNGKWKKWITSCSKK